jgi:hypothetical protein
MCQESFYDVAVIICHVTYLVVSGHIVLLFHLIVSNDYG